MKKVLFATTALVATAGIAAADVELSGSAEMGIVGGDGIETQFHHDLDVKFSLSGETDNGLTFGATIDLDEVGDDGSSVSCTTTTFLGFVTSVSGCFGGGDPIASTSGEHSVWIKGSFGNLTMGDTDGAFDWALTEALIGGDIVDAIEMAGYNGNSGLDGVYDGQILRYDYSFANGLALAASVELDDSGTFDPVLGIGMKYSTDLSGVELGFGLGYQSAESVDVMGISISAAFGSGFEAIINYSDLDAAGDHYGIALGYETGALSIGLNYGMFDTPAGDIDGVSLSVNYDLGGGAVVQFGYGSSDTLGVSSDLYSLGVAMSF